MERGAGEKSALAEIRDSFGMKTFAIVTLQEIIDFLHNKNIDGRVVLDDAIKSKIEEYRKEYGC
jgi:orotate phosphoribosyltransferase